jgi:hypothetical protein
VRRALEPDGAVAVDLEAVDAGGLARDLGAVVGRQVAAELVDQEPEPGAARLGKPRPRAVGERQPGTRHALVDVDTVRRAAGAGQERLEGERVARGVERGALPEPQRTLLGHGRQLLAPLDGRAPQPEEVEHRVAHVGHGGEDAAGEHEQRGQGDR